MRVAFGYRLCRRRLPGDDGCSAPSPKHFAEGYFGHYDDQVDSGRFHPSQINETDQELHRAIEDAVSRLETKNREDFLLETGCDVSFRDADEDAQSGDAATAVDVVSDSFPQGKLMAKARTPDKGKRSINGANATLVPIELSVNGGVPMDQLRPRLLQLIEEERLTLHDLGIAMGLGSERTPAATAAWNFLHQSKNPTVQTLARFARAVRHPVYELFVTPWLTNRAR